VLIVTQVLINCRNNKKLLGRVKAFDRHCNMVRRRTTTPNFSIRAPSHSVKHVAELAAFHSCNDEG
jgi:small nuclear ribonucleoprotein (snRNP)-like protein